MAEPRPLPDGPVHFVGIGGAGMSAIAFVLASRGVPVSGSDPGISETAKSRLEGVGCRIFPGPHASENVPENIVALVVTDAVKGENPEIAEAERRGVPIFKRPEVLGGIVNSAKVSICVAGTHGKTTTTGMVASILLTAGLEPTVLIGGDLPMIEGNAYAGDPNIVVVEACEAYGGLDWLRPTIALVLNVEADHLDFHGTEENFYSAFERFLAKSHHPVVCSEIETHVAQKILGDRYGMTSSYGFSGGVWTPDEDTSVFRLLGYAGTEEEPQRIALNVPGRHNVLNALGAAAAVEVLGIKPLTVAAGLNQFTGTGRRFERLGETKNGVIVVDDYAHHPTEIRATLQGARQAFPENRLVAIFQPHLPSRTENFMQQFADALAQGGADTVYLTSIYLAREAHRPGLIEELAERVRNAPPTPSPFPQAASGLLGEGKLEGLHSSSPESDAKRLGRGGRGVRATLVSDRFELPELLLTELKSGDVAIFMGAGNIREQAEAFLSLPGAI